MTMLFRLLASTCRASFRDFGRSGAASEGGGGDARSSFERILSAAACGYASVRVIDDRSFNAPV